MGNSGTKEKAARQASGGEPGSAAVIRYGALDMQVCVPDNWTDNHVEQFADMENECGTAYGWAIRKKGGKLLDGQPERNPCVERNGFVHITLDA